MSINEILDQIERGLDGVTPGPWTPHRNSAFWELVPNNAGSDDIPYIVADFCSSDPEDTTGLQEVNAAHIARCDPDTMRAIIDAYRQMEARAEAAEAENLEQARLLGMGAERELSLLGRAEAAEAKVARLTEALAPFSEIPRESVEGYDTYAPVQMKAGALTWYGLSLHHFLEAAKAMDETQ